MKMRFLKMALSLLLCLLPLKAFADQQNITLASGLLPITLDKPVLSRDLHMVIEGVVSGTEPVVVVLRMDDSASTDYASRLNLERQLNPGPFVWNLSVAGLQTSSGRPLDVASIKRLMLFEGVEAGKVTISAIKLQDAPNLGANILALSLGAADAPLFAGFERITADDPRLGAGAIAVSRPGVDALIGSGLKNLSTLNLTAQPGQARLSLWLEDTGEWETLPPSLERRIRLNGQTLYEHKLSESQWLAKHYLALGYREPIGQRPDPWAEIGAHRGQRITQIITVPENGVLNLSFTGDNPTSTFVSALLLEPEGTTALEKVEQARAEAFRSTWPLSHQPKTPAATPALTLKLDVDKAVNGKQNITFEGQNTLILARTMADMVRITVTSQKTLQNPMLQFGKSPFETKVWAQQRHLERQSVNANMLALSENHLRANISAYPVEAGQERSYAVWISAPKDLAAGRYKLPLYFLSSDDPRTIAAEIEVEVLPVDLPQVTKNAGFYLDEAPHLGFITPNAKARFEQASCDLEFLQSLGITGNAPMFSTPVANREDLFKMELDAALQNANQPPFLAYASAKRLHQQLGAEAAAQAIANIEKMVSEKGLPPLLWAVADEPSNAAHGVHLGSDFLKALREKAPTARLAAQLNTPKDMELASTYDVALVNPGFGVDQVHINRLIKQGVEPWIYNTDAPRLTAGLWLKNSPASRYVQWHARMPTANPFDPTDGREGDVMGFLPSMQVCAPQPDIHLSLLAMAQGLVDQRWLLWLDAQNDEQSQLLRSEINDLITHGWQLVSANPEVAHAVRQEIMNLARNLNNKS